METLSPSLRYGDIVRRSKTGAAQPVISFTQFDIDALLVEYREKVPGKRTDGALLSVSNGVKTVEDLNLRCV